MTIRSYTYDLAGNLIGEGNATAIQREYIWLPEDAGDTGASALPLALVTAVTTTPVISRVHADHLNRPIRMTSAAKATVWSASWKPFGEPQALSATIENNLRFPGQYFLIETALAYNWHRTYDPTTGRYTQPDPLRFVDGPSVYAYVKGSPLMGVDREGLADSRFRVRCGRCWLIYDTDNQKGAHTHWQCPGQPQGCIKKDGTLCDGSSAPPDGVLQCLKDRKRVPENCIPEQPVDPSSLLPWVGAGAAGAGIACMFIEPCGVLVGGGLVIGGALAQ